MNDGGSIIGKKPLEPPPYEYSPMYEESNGKYEFMLTYPEKHPGQYNRWK